MTTVTLNGLGPNINSERLRDAELLLGWSRSLDTERVTLAEYEKREEERAESTALSRDSGPQSSSEV